MNQIHRVRRGPKHPPVPQPKDEWREGIFIEADGTEMIVMFSGKHMPTVNVPRRPQRSCQQIGTTHMPRTT